jgi:hypothetical protein
MSERKCNDGEVDSGDTGMDQWEPMWRSDYQTNYSQMGRSYEDFRRRMPAVRLANHASRGRLGPGEPAAQRDSETGHYTPGDFKARAFRLMSAGTG